MLTLSVFLDLTNAFDSIDHDSFLQAFLQNLKALGVVKKQQQQQQQQQQRKQ